jgi:hypothetical protein
LWPGIASLPVAADCVDAEADEWLELGVHALFVFTASKIGLLNKCFVASAGGACTEISLTKAHDEI